MPPARAGYRSAQRRGQPLCGTRKTWLALFALLIGRLDLQCHGFGSRSCGLRSSEWGHPPVEPGNADGPSRPHAAASRSRQGNACCTRLKGFPSAHHCRPFLSAWQRAWARCPTGCPRGQTRPVRRQSRRPSPPVGVAGSGPRQAIGLGSEKATRTKSAPVSCPASAQGRPCPSTSSGVVLGVQSIMTPAGNECRLSVRSEGGW